MTLNVFRYLAPTIALLLANSPVLAASPNCGAMADDGPAWFAAQLDKARSVFQAGNSSNANAELWIAITQVPRTVDVSLEGRCVGLPLWQRFYDLRREVTRALGQQAETAGQLANANGALDWYVDGGNRDDAQRVMPKLTPTARGTASIIFSLRDATKSLDRAVELNFELLPDERSARTFWQTRLDETIAHARKQGTAVLAQEPGVLTREATAQEQQIEQVMADQQALVASLLDDESLAATNEARRDVRRGSESLDLLKSARDWLQAISVADAAPVRERAVMRGDALMTRAGDPSMSLEARDSLYEAAGDYFKFAEARDLRRAAEQGRAAIEPALRAERDQQSARLDKKTDQLQQSAEQLKQSMEKTEAQKESFKQEADAMEDELGF